MLKKSGRQKIKNLAIQSPVATCQLEMSIWASTSQFLPVPTQPHFRRLYFPLTPVGSWVCDPQCKASPVTAGHSKCSRKGVFFIKNSLTNRAQNLSLLVTDYYSQWEIKCHGLTATVYSNIYSKCLVNTCCLLRSLLGPEGKMLRDQHHPDFHESPGDAKERGTYNTGRKPAHHNSRADWERAAVQSADTKTEIRPKGQQQPLKGFQWVTRPDWHAGGRVESA